MRHVGHTHKIGVYAVVCPSCKAEPGFMCHTIGYPYPQRICQPHAPRLAQSRAKEALERTNRT